jgi:hemerythrin-like metal-binding protein
MALLEWQEKFRVGVASVDHEHQELIALINRLHSAARAAASDAAILDFLGEIHTRISAHFALEEKHMRERGYDHYTEHKHDHERLLDGIRDIMDEFEDNFEYDEAALGRHLNDWFALHFRTHDARLHQLLGVVAHG